MNNPILVEVLRGTELESAHSGAVAVVDADGHLVASLGDVERLVFPRSAVKVLQALPLITSGAAERLGLSDAELALACASHSGEPEHVQTALSMLHKAGLDADALECGTQWPTREPVLKAMIGRGETATPLHNNCSGKHAGFVCLACELARHDVADGAAYTRGYIGVDHPVMQAVSAALGAATDTDLSRAPRGVDGCSIPTYAIALRKLALAFARVGTGHGLSPENARAARRLRQAVARAPFMVGGSQRFDTRVMTYFGERVFCKVGAEGVYCASFPERGLGVALKIDDGNPRGAEVAMATLIEILLSSDASEHSWLGQLSHPVLHNWNQLAVGSLRPSAELTALRPAVTRQG
jgi:L-asparaginase II